MYNKSSCWNPKAPNWRSGPSQEWMVVCTSTGVSLELCSICMIFVADLIAWRLGCFMSAVACRAVTPKLWSGFLVWLLWMVPVAPSGMVWRGLRCGSFSSLCCPCAFYACCKGWVAFSLALSFPLLLSAPRFCFWMCADLSWACCSFSLCLTGPLVHRHSSAQLFPYLLPWYVPHLSWTSFPDLGSRH